MSEKPETNHEQILAQALFAVLAPSEGVVVRDEDGNTFTIYSCNVDGLLKCQPENPGELDHIPSGTMTWMHGEGQAPMEMPEDGEILGTPDNGADILGDITRGS